MCPPPTKTIEQVRSLIRDALDTYIKSLRQSWADSNDMNIYSCNVFVSRVSSAVVNVPGVSNVTSVTLNGEAQDIFLTQSGTVQQLPKLGEVTLNV